MEVYPELDCDRLPSPSSDNMASALRVLKTERATFSGSPIFVYFNLEILFTTAKIFHPGLPDKKV